MSTAALLDPARGDGLTATAPVLERVGDVRALIAAGEDEALSAALRRQESVGRPLGDEGFLDLVRDVAGRDARPARRERRPIAK